KRDRHVEMHAGRSLSGLDQGHLELVLSHGEAACSQQLRLTAKEEGFARSMSEARSVRAIGAAEHELVQAICVDAELGHSNRRPGQDEGEDRSEQGGPQDQQSELEWERERGHGLPAPSLVRRATPRDGSADDHLRGREGSWRRSWWSQRARRQVLCL